MQFVFGTLKTGLYLSSSHISEKEIILHWNITINISNENRNAESNIGRTICFAWTFIFVGFDIQRKLKNIHSVI